MASEYVASKSAYCDENTCTRQSNVFSSQYADFHATSSDAIIFKTKDFSGFLFRFWNLHEMENILEKKESLLA